MSKQQWKAVALFLISLLVGFVILVGTTPLSDKVLAQMTSIAQCKVGVAPGSWEYQALQSLTERYGAITENTCRNGEFRAEHPEVRADMADWLQVVLGRVDELIASASKDGIHKKELDELNQLYEQVLAQVETLEKQKQSR